LRRRRESLAGRQPIRFGLRPRLLAALVFTAAATLAVAALALLAPLESQLRKNEQSVLGANVSTAQTRLGTVQLVSPHRVGSYKKRIQDAAITLATTDHDTVVVWTRSLRHLADTDRDTDAQIPTYLARRGFSAPTPLAKQPKPEEVNNVLYMAARYRAENGVYYVVEMFKPVDYLGTANGVVRSAFLLAALVGLAVAILIGTGLSSRLLRRLRLLQDASLDEHALGTLVVPRERITDEIDELAHSFSTMHARLRQQEDARRAFVATASHELRTPLASLDGMLELLADDLAAEPLDLVDARERVASAQQQSRRLRGLASDLLDLSRLDAALDLRSEAVELGETARAVAAEFDARARERGVALALDEVNGTSWAQADPGSVARIVRILLDNALRVAPADSMIEIRIGGFSGEPVIEVSDVGPGVPAQDRELIFERFQRGSVRSDEGGFGLGLAIGSELAVRMGGRLELTEEAPGATFRLSLPEVPR
jgi:signal transduction histidine kinase